MKKPRGAPPSQYAYDLKVENLPIGDITEYPNNSRMHSVEQIDLIAKSIKEYGFTNPCLIDSKSELIAGAGRLAAAKLLAMETVPVIRLGHLTPTQKRALVIADNKIAITGTQWDLPLLKGELAELKLDGFNLELTGFDGAELDKLFPERRAGLTDDDEVPDAPKEPVSALGDVWLLGGHRIMCGDSTNLQHIETLMAGAKADLCFTSPPYGQQRDYKAAITDWDVLMQGVFSILPVKHEAQVLVNLGLIHREGEWLPYWGAWIDWMRAAQWRRFGWYVWDQGSGLPGDWNGRLGPSFEFIFHFNHVAERARKTKDSKVAGQAVAGKGLRGADGVITRKTNEGGIYQPKKIPDSVIRVTRHQGGIGDAGKHPALFPVALVTEIMTAFSDKNDLVFEPFLGGGTQIIGAEKNDRICYGMEIAPAYTDVAVCRWQLFTGKTAIHAADGRPFPLPHS